MTNRKTIKRRDFLSGIALTGATLGLSPYEAMAKGMLNLDSEKIYPPALTGMRGSHPGSFEVAHAISWNGKKYNRPEMPTDAPYDLIIVGGGISGLATAHYARKKLGESVKILILDNHDDFGGHAKRNEFSVDGKTLIGHGGSQSIDSPASFSAEAISLIKEIGIEPEKFNHYFDRKFKSRHKLGSGLYLKDSKQLFSNNQYNIFEFEDEQGRQNVGGIINQLPLSKADKQAMTQLFVDQVDWLKGHNKNDKLSILKRSSLQTLLRKYAGLSDAAMDIFLEDTKTLLGSAWDSWSGHEALLLYHPATMGLGIDPGSLEKAYSDEPYIYHFPDGNASISRLLVKRLVPKVAGNLNMESVVKARFDYGQLDRLNNPTRIRLNSTVIKASNVKEGVEVQYVRAGKVERVMGKRAVMACYNHILPFIMPEIPDDQVKALQSVEKVPLTYINVAVRNWQPWKKAGIWKLMAPGCVVGKAQLDYPVSMGGYQFSQSADDPAILHLIHCPVVPGLHPSEQARQGRHQMYAMTIDDYERELKQVLEGAFAKHGFEFQQDVAAITVNRWPHGYTYEYNELYDNPEFGPYHGSAGGPDKGPHVLGRRAIGKISIANSDSSAYAYVQGALDAAYRAVGELYN